MKTRYDILPHAQRAVLGALRPARDLGFVLYGGTASALRLGHRESIDFDFFTSAKLDVDRLIRTMPMLAMAVALQREPDAWTVQVMPTGGHDRPVKLSFFGSLDFGRVGRPTLTDGGELLLASALDLLGHKLKVLLQRVEAKDYRDIAALLRSGLRLGAGLGAASALFGAAFPPADAVRALSYFKGGDLATLPNVDRKTLLSAVKEAGPIEPAAILSSDLT